MDIKYVKSNIYDGMKFSKPKVKSKIIKVLKDGFTYKIGENGNYKKVTFREVEGAIEKVEQTGSFNRIWYEETFPREAKSNPCNFTSIGGVLQELGYVKYVDKKYIKIDK